MLYEKHGVREYWIVFPDARMVFIYILEKNGTFRKPAVAKSNETIAVGVLSGVKIDLVRVFSS